MANYPQTTIINNNNKHNIQNICIQLSVVPYQISMFDETVEQIIIINNILGTNK